MLGHVRKEKKGIIFMKKIKLSTKMLVGMVLGLICGAMIGPSISVISPVGTIYVNLLKMCMVPVIVVSVVLSIASVADLKSFSRLGRKVVIFYLCTSLLAATIGVALATIIQPGKNFTGDIDLGAVERTIPSVVDSLVDIVPTNIIQAMADADLISLVFFSVLFGISLSMIGADKKKPVLDLLVSLNEGLLKMISLCLNWVAPIGVFALMANMAGKNGVDVIAPLGRFLLTEYVGIFVLVFGVYGTLLHFVANINIFTFLARVKEPLITAFSSCSSAATVPLEIELSESHMGVPKEIAGFTFPLGGTINLDGTALNIPICLLFSAQIYDINFSIAELVIIIFLGLIMSIGVAGVPGGGTIFILMILGQFNVPTDAFALILASFVLIDTGLTATNICADMACTICICKSEGKLDESVWATGPKLEANEI